MPKFNIIPHYLHLPSHRQSSIYQMTMLASIKYVHCEIFYTNHHHHQAKPEHSVSVTIFRISFTVTDINWAWIPKVPNIKSIWQARNISTSPPYGWTNNHFVRYILYHCSSLIAFTRIYSSIFVSPLLLSPSSSEFTLISTNKSCLFSLSLSNTHFFMLIFIFSRQHVGAVKPCNDFNRQILSKWTKSCQTFIRSTQPGYRINRFHEHQ